MRRSINYRPERAYESFAESFSNYDVIDSRIDVGAQKALIRMKANPATSGDAAAMLAAVKSGQLAGIYGDDLRAAAQLAARLGTVRWELVPRGQVAALIRIPGDPTAAPTIIFREQYRSNPSRLDPALLAAWRSFSSAPPGNGGVQVIEHPLLGYLRVLGRGAPLPPTVAAAAARRRAPSRSRSAEYIIIGDDERRPVRNTLPVPFRFICQLQLVFTDPTDSTKTIIGVGSGTLISDRHVLTVGHALFISLFPNATPPTPRVSPSMIFVSPGFNGSQQLGSSITASMRFRPEWLASEDPNFDFGIITLPEPLGAIRRPALGNRPLGFWGSPQFGGGTRIETSRLNQMAGMGVRVAGYAGDKCDDQPTRGSFTRAQIRANCPIGLDSMLQWVSPGNIVHPAAPDAPRVLSYNNDTFGGQSGGPVWSQQRGLNLVGIHRGPFPLNVPVNRRNLNCGVRITDPLLQQLREWMRADGVTPTF